MSTTGAGSAGNGGGSGGSQGGSAGGPAGNGGGQGGGQPESHWLRNGAVAAGAIVTIGGIVVAIVNGIFGQTNSESAAGAKPPEQSSSSPSAEDPCELGKLASDWNRPAVRTYSVKVDPQAPPVYTQASASRNPEVSIRGQVRISIPQGEVLYLVRHPDQNSKDEYGKSGSINFYPAKRVSPEPVSGCWGDDNRALGYPGSEGLSMGYYLVLVGQQQADQFTRDAAIDRWDGYSPAAWSAFAASNVLSFKVSTS